MVVHWERLQLILMWYVAGPNFRYQVCSGRVNPADFTIYSYGLFRTNTQAKWLLISLIYNYIHSVQTNYPGRVIPADFTDLQLHSVCLNQLQSIHQSSSYWFHWPSAMVKDTWNSSMLFFQCVCLSLAGAATSIIFVATKVLLQQTHVVHCAKLCSSRQKTCFVATNKCLSWQMCVCYNKNYTCGSSHQWYVFLWVLQAHHCLSLIHIWRCRRWP